MALLREPPTCPFCGEIIAEGIYKNQSHLPIEMMVIGDTFLRWEYLPHSCEGKTKALKEIQMPLAGAEPEKGGESK